MKKIITGIAAAAIAVAILYNYPIPDNKFTRTLTEYAEPLREKAESLKEKTAPLAEQVVPITDRMQESLENLAIMLEGLLQEKRPAGEALTELEASGISYYYFHQFSEKEQELYAELWAGMNEMQEKIALTTADDQTIWKVFCGVLSDHPELFWVEYAYTGSSAINRAVIMPEYNCSPEEREAKEENIKAAAGRALEAIGQRDSDYEKAKGVFDYIIDATSYSLGAADNQNMYSALVNGVSVCAGYSRASQYLLQQLGLEAIYITGQVTEPENIGHAWNIVCCDGQYYHFDATFGDRAFSSGKVSGMPDTLYHDYTYLCCDDQVIYRDRITDPELEVPVCGSEALDFFRKNDLCFPEWGQAVQDRIRLRISEGQHYFRCSFSSDQAYQDACQAINEKWFVNQLIEYGAFTGGTVHSWSVYDDVNRVICLWY